MEKISTEFYRSKFLFLKYFIKIFTHSRTLLPYIYERLIFVIREFLNFSSLYPTENKYRFDYNTEKILNELKSSIGNKSLLDNLKWKDINSRERKAIQVSNYIKEITGKEFSKKEHPSLNSLINNGLIKFDDKKLIESEIDSIMNYLEDKKVYASHYHHFSIKKAAHIDKIKRQSSFGSYDLKTIINAPYIIDILTDQDILRLVCQYFGCWPTIQSVNIFWSFPSSRKKNGTQHFHRDVEDYKTSSLFLNLTDSDIDDGAHCYIKKSHSLKTIKEIFNSEKNNNLPRDINPFNKNLIAENFFNLPLNGYSNDKLYQYFFKDHITHLYGEKGSAILTDNYGIHRGIPPKSKDRLILWVSYSLSSNSTETVSHRLPQRIKYKDLNKSINDNNFNRYLLRNLINFS